LTTASNNQLKKETGSYYTPADIVQYMIGQCLSNFCTTDFFPRFLDSACGDGAFLAPLFDELVKRLSNNSDDANQRLEIFRACIFGVDIDAAAVSVLREKMERRIAPPRSLLAETRDALQENLKHADSLSGPDFFSVQHVTEDIDESKPAGYPEPLDWKEAFPAVAADGGFDCIIGNPPYRRELNSKPLFDYLAASGLGETWRQARMDLWYYFLHRGLDLLKPDGRLAFIVNSYWTSSFGARKLIDRLSAETTLEEIVLLGKQRLFRDVTGNHLMFFLQKSVSNKACQIIDQSHRAESVRYSLSRDELFQHGQLILQKPDPVLKRINAQPELETEFDVRQGMAENPPWITARLNKKFDNRFQTGQGVFVLTSEEIESLQFNSTERLLLRPYFKTSSLNRYRMPIQPDGHVLYLTKQTAPDIVELPNIKQHLEPFRPILDQRREVQNGSIKWWHLHWPREERIFQQPGILSVQMGARPQFVFAEQPAYFGFSVNVILQGINTENLLAWTGILNSQLAERWFTAYAKKRGVHLEINGNTLKRFPLPKPNRAVQSALANLVRQRMDQKGYSETSKLIEIESLIEEHVCRLYGVLPQSEILKKSA